MAHLIRSTSNSGQYTAYCGHQQQSNYNLTTSPDYPNLCSKCSSRYYREQVKESPYRLGERMDLANDPRRYKYKSIYEIYAGDAVIGFVTIKNGWGQDWHVNSWRDGGGKIDEVARGEVRQPIMSFDVVAYRRKPEDRMEFGGSFSSKEEALFRVPLMVEQGKLPSRDAVFANSQKNVATLREQMAAQEARRKAVADQRTEDLRLIREEFADLLASGRMTNRQHIALTKAAEMIGVKFS